MWWAWARNSLLPCALVLTGCTKASQGKESLSLLLASSLIPISDALGIAVPQSASLDLNFLSSAAIAQQIEQGAPCDAAILASDRWYDHLRALGLTSGQAVIIAKNRLVLAALAPTSQRAATLEQELISSSAIVVADEAHAPLGAYTRQALESLNILPKLSARLVKASSARQAVVMLEQGIAERAILFESDAIFAAHIKVVHSISEKLHEPIRYWLFACKNHGSKGYAIIADILSKPAVKQALLRYGFVRD